ncbi:MFS transporter [Halalkalibacter oceani]|uniref:MFS transporter n=1 Tax=Halalkalibacter oceani TaxID=1653776 RepID=UPI003398B92B
MSRLIYVLIVVVFIDTFIQLPIISPYAVSVGAGDVLVGAIVAVYSLANMAGNVIGGHWIDRLGYKKMLAFGMVTVGLVLLLYPLAQTGEQLFVIRFLHGLAGGVLIPAAFALIGERSGAGRKGKTMAFAGAAIGIAAITGPAIGGALASRGEYSAVFFFTAGLFFVALLVCFPSIPQQATAAERSKVKWQDVWLLMKQLPLLQASMAAFALMVSNGTLAYALPLKVGEIDFTTATTGMLLSLYGITALVVFVTPLNRIYEWFRAWKLVVTGLVLIALSLTIIHFVLQIEWLVLAMLIYGTGFSLVFPSMNQMVADASTAVNRGKAYGIFYAFFSLGVVAGSLLSGFAREQFGAPFLFSALLMLSCTALLVLFSFREKTGD